MSSPAALPPTGFPLSAAPGASRSGATATEDEVIVDPPKRSFVRWPDVAKQAKFIVGGGIPAWVLDVPERISTAVAGDPEGVPFWTRPLAYTTLLSMVATVVLFGWLFTLPLRGKRPNYAQWHNDPNLRVLIPQLSLTIIVGFVSLLWLLGPLGTSGPPRYGWSPGGLATWAKEWIVNQQLFETRFWAWVRALIGSISTFLFLFGTVGLLGSLRPPMASYRLKDQ